jgi:hypothetical protein
MKNILMKLEYIIGKYNISYLVPDINEIDIYKYLYWNDNDIKEPCLSG